MWYREGTKTLINGSNIVTGVGTSWSKAENGVLPGMILLGEKGEPYEIKSVESDTSLTLVEPYDGKNVNDTPCRIITTYQGDISQFSARFAAQLQRMNIDSGVIRSWLTSGQDAQLLAEDGTEITLKALRQIVAEHEDAMAWFSANQDSILKAAANATAAASSASAALASQKAAKTSETNSAGSASASASSKAAAAASASSAAASEKNAKTSEVNAKTSETAASGSATASATSETNAKASESSAASSASKAATSESNAAASASSAASSKGAAATSASNAGTSATNAKTSETNAKKSESNAKASENAAAASQSAAAASETNASTSETNAGASASAAKAYETNAAGSKTAAATSATNAKSSETNAASSKSAAATSATSAASSEANASTSEANAKKSETNAKASENAAASSNSNAGKSAAAAKTSENNAAASASEAKQAAQSLNTDNMWQKTDLVKQTTTQDATAGHVMTVGAFGLGGRSPAPTGGPTNLSDPAYLNAGASWSLSGTFDDAPVGITAITGQLRCERRYWNAGAAIIQWLTIQGGTVYRRAGTLAADDVTLTWYEGDAHGWRKMLDTSSLSQSDVTGVGIAGLGDQYGDNMVINPHFLPTGTINSGGSGCSIEFLQVSDAAAPANSPEAYIGKIVRTSATGSVVLYTIPTYSSVVTPGETLDVSCWIHSANASGNNLIKLVVTQTDATGKVVENTRVGVYADKTGGWQKLAGSLTLSSTTVSVSVRVWLETNEPKGTIVCFANPSMQKRAGFAAVGATSDSPTFTGKPFFDGDTEFGKGRTVKLGYRLGIHREDAFPAYQVLSRADVVDGVNPATETVVGQIVVKTASKTTDINAGRNLGYLSVSALTDGSGKVFLTAVNPTNNVTSRLALDGREGLATLLGDMLVTGELRTSGRVAPGDFSNFDGRYLAVSANAVSATKLQSARKIAGKPFDGTSDIVLGADDVGAVAAGNSGTVSGDTSVAWNAKSGVYNATRPSDSVVVAQFYTGVGSARSFQLKAHYKNGGLFYRSSRDAAGFEAGFEQIYTTGFKPTAADVGALSSSGGVVDGQLTVNSNAEALILKRKAASQALYIRGRGEDNSLRWYIGNGGADDVFTITNYIQNTTMQLNASELYTSRNIRAAGTLTLNGSGESNAVVGSGTSDVFLQNSKSGKYLQLKDTGVLAYSGYAIYHQGNKPTPDEIGAYPASGGQLSGPVVSTDANGFRIKSGAISSFFRNDGGSSYFLLTASGDQDGTWNSLRPIYWNNTTGNVTMGHAVGVNGKLTANGGLQSGDDITVPTSSGSWISMRDGKALQGSAAVATSSAAAIVRQEHADRHYVLGGLGNSQFGIYMMNKSRTANGTDAGAYLTNDGTWYCSGNGNFNDVYVRSDRRNKRNIKKIDSALDKLEKIDGVLYEIQNMDGYVQSGGLVAQQVQEVQPELVTSDIDHASQEERLRLNYNGVIGMLVEAVKELRAEVKELKEAM